MNLQNPIKLNKKMNENPEKTPPGVVLEQVFRNFI